MIYHLMNRLIVSNHKMAFSSRRNFLRCPPQIPIIFCPKIPHSGLIKTLKGLGRYWDMTELLGFF
jgi:hypothetical protein